MMPVLEIGLVVVLVVGLVIGAGRLADRLLRSRLPAGAGPPDAALTALLALVLRFFGVLALCITLVLRAGDHRVPLVSAVGATYFAAILIDAWRAGRKTRPQTADLVGSTGDIESSGKASKG